MPARTDAQIAARRAAWATLLPNEAHARLLTACLPTAQDANTAWQAFLAEAGDARLYFEADRNGLKALLPWVAHSISSRRIRAADDFRTYAKLAMLREELRSEIYHDVLADVAQALDSAAIDFVAMRGAAYGERIYPSTRIRHNHAIDLCVPVRNSEARRALKGVGFCVGAEGELLHHSGLPVLLHTNLLDLPMCPRTPEPRRVPWTHGGVLAKQQDPAGQLSNALATATASPGNRNLRWVVDAWLLIAEGEVDWQSFVTDVETLGLTCFCAHALTFLQDRLDADIPEWVIERLSETAVDTRAEATTRLFASLLTVNRTHGRTRAELAASPALKSRYLMFALVPPPAYLRWRHAESRLLALAGLYLVRPLRGIARRLRRRLTAPARLSRST